LGSVFGGDLGLDDLVGDFGGDLWGDLWVDLWGATILELTILVLAILEFVYSGID
jgi:hypothetical protein